MLGLHAGALISEITVDYRELEYARCSERDWLLSHKDGDTFRLDRLPPDRGLAARPLILRPRPSVTGGAGDARAADQRHHKEAGDE
jgi:hypothetical protein